MKTLLILPVLFMAFSCRTNYYLDDPIKGIPAIGLQPYLPSNGILIASNSNLAIDTAYFENCLQSVSMYLETRSKIKIMDEIYFRKRPNLADLTELQTNYKVDGMLLLIDLDVQNYSYTVPSGKFAVGETRPNPNSQIFQYSINWTNVLAKAVSHWEYYDFTTGRSYQFSIKNDDELELGQYVADLDAYMEKNSGLLDALFYRNGALTASQLLNE